MTSRHHKSLTLGFSPCPNDTFIFDALVNGKIESNGLKFDVVMEDVESLNKRAMRGELDVTKISFAAFTKVADQYSLLNSGSALGRGVGPLVISKTTSLSLQNPDVSIAIPGINTTANFLFSLFFPDVKNKKEMIFSEIENAVLKGEVDAGVIIHENRFTYASKGLKKICDLGEMWEKKMGKPIPLGGIAIKKSLPEELKRTIDELIRKSVEYAFSNPKSSEEYVKQHAQEMEADVRRKHIETYVNKFSVDLGEEGRDAIRLLFQKALEAGIINSIPKDIFIEQEKAVA